MRHPVEHTLIATMSIYCFAQLLQEISLTSRRTGRIGNKGRATSFVGNSHLAFTFLEECITTMTFRATSNFSLKQRVGLHTSVIDVIANPKGQGGGWVVLSFIFFVNTLLGRLSQLTHTFGKAWIH